MWNLISVHSDRVLVLAQDRCTVCAKCTGSEIILDAPDGTMTRLKWRLVSVHLEIVLVSVHDSSMVCAKCIIGSKLFWTHPMVLLCDEAYVEAGFGLFGDSANLDSR
jgi:hypothetical protein